MASTLTTRPIFLTREGSVFRLAFDYDKALVDKVRELPGAEFNKNSRTWTATVCTQSVEGIRRLFYEGLCDVAVDTLIADGENIPTPADATLRAGTTRRPYRVRPLTRDQHLFSRLNSVTGALWDKGSASMTYPPHAAAALHELVTRGVVDDPERVLSVADVTITFDGRNGRFAVLGDPRAQEAFDAWFPAHDVAKEWTDKGFEVAFSDQFAEEVYRGERARISEGIQPAGIAVDLYPYQRQSVAVALERSGLGLYLVPGLGKTIIAVATGHELAVNRGEITRTVAVVPAAVRGQWRDEIIRFTGDDNIVVVDGDLKKRKKLYEQADEARWVILPSSDVLNRDEAHITPLVRGSLLVADEAHRYKGYQTARTKMMGKYAKVAARRLALTGTPVINNPSEWYTLMNGFVVPGVFGSPDDFHNRYSYPGRFGGYEGSRREPELRDRSKPHYIRFTKSEVATHLPPLRVRHQALDPDPEWRNVLRQVHRDAAEEIRTAALAVAESVKRVGANALDGADYDEVTTGAEMTAVGMLRRLCSSPRLLWASDATAAVALCEAGLVPDKDGPKLDWLRTFTSELAAGGERVVVFTHSSQMAELIVERFGEDGIATVLFTGSTSSSDREAAVAAFTTPGTDQNPGPVAFVATDAAAEGLNLGRCCSTLVNFDVPWSASVLEQRSNRIHRVDGTATSYDVINLTLRGTIEDGLLKMVERKVDLSDALFGEQGGRRRTTGRGGRNNLIAEAFADYDLG